MPRQRKRPARLTESMLADLRKDPDGPQTQVVRDETVRTLAVRLAKDRRHSFVVNKKTIGRWPDMSLAEARAAAVRVDNELGAARSASLTWRQCFDYWTANRTTRKGIPLRESSTMRGIDRVLYTMRDLADRPVSATEPKHIDAWLKREYEDKPGAWNMGVNVCNAAFNFCRRRRVIPNLPTPVLAEKRASSPNRDFLAVDELDRWLDSLHEHRFAPYAHAYATISYGLALRGREALELLWSDVRDDVIVLRQRKTSIQHFRAPLYPSVRAALDTLPRSTETDLIFPPMAPNGPDSRWHSLPMLLNQSLSEMFPGRSVPLHTLRRARATHLRDSGATVAAIAKLTGHTSAALEVYLGHASRAAMDDLSVANMRKRLKR